LIPKIISYDRLVKSEDLNHHGTLFAGRCAEWFVEAAFIAAASVLPAGNVVCLKLQGLEFTRPIYLGQIARFESKIIHTGKSSLMVHVELRTIDDLRPLVNGFITFVHIDEKGQPEPHGLQLEWVDEKDLRLHELAKELRQ